LLLIAFIFFSFNNISCILHLLAAYLFFFKFFIFISFNNLYFILALFIPLFFYLKMSLYSSRLKLQKRNAFFVTQFPSENQFSLFKKLTHRFLSASLILPTAILSTPRRDNPVKKSSPMSGISFPPVQTRYTCVNEYSLLLVRFPFIARRNRLCLLSSLPTREVLVLRLYTFLSPQSSRDDFPVSKNSLQTRLAAASS